eukprot:302042_1
MLFQTTINHMSCLKLLVTLLISEVLLNTLSTTANNKTKIKIYAISTTTDKGITGRSIVPAQNISINDINNDPNMLSGYYLEFELLGCDGDPNNALKHAVDVVTTPIVNSNTLELICPVILGCPWSSFSIRTAPVLGAYYHGQIASTATSVALSDTKSYPFFYRTIPNDALQGKALVELAKTFNWNRIGVVYFDDNYGFNLNKVIVDESKKYSIDVLSTHYSLLDIQSFSNVAEFIKLNKLYVTILIVKSRDLAQLLQNFNDIAIL